MVKNNEIDLGEKYGFRIIHRDFTKYDYLNPFTKFIVYFVIENNHLYYITTNKDVGLADEIEDYGLDPLSGHGIDFIEKDYQIAYHDERDKCIFTEEIFKKFCEDGEFSINTEKKLKRFYRKRKIDNYFNSKK
jgi:hypothetical protein